MPIQAVSDWILVRRDPGNKLMAGGLLHPNSLLSNHMTGTVVSVGPGRVDERACRRIRPDVKPGDRVQFHPLRCPEIEVDGEKLICLRPKGVLVKWTEEDD